MGQARFEWVSPYFLVFGRSPFPFLINEGSNNKRRRVKTARYFCTLDRELRGVLVKT